VEETKTYVEQKRTQYWNVEKAEKKTWKKKRTQLHWMPSRFGRRKSGREKKRYRENIE